MREKYVNGYFALSCLIVNDFLLFKVLFSKSNKKVQSAEVTGVLIAGSFRVLSSRSRVSGPGFWVPSSGIPSHRVLDPGYWVLGCWVLGPQSQVHSPGFQGPSTWVQSPWQWVSGFWVLSPGSQVFSPRSWVLGPHFTLCSFTNILQLTNSALQ